MRYNNLHALMKGSMSSRQYFLSLPVELQMRLHDQDEWIHTAEELHQAAEMTERQMRIENIGKW